MKALLRVAVALSVVLISARRLQAQQGNGMKVKPEGAAAIADLSITKTDSANAATPGGSVTYTITASNAGPSNAPGSTVTDTLPASLTCTWTCAGSAGGTCTASGSGNINDTVNLPAGGSVIYTVMCTISASATGSLSNTASVAPPLGVTDLTPGNNAATDTDALAGQVPTLSPFGLLVLASLLGGVAFALLKRP